MHPKGYTFGVFALSAENSCIFFDLCYNNFKQVIKNDRELGGTYYG